MDYNEDLISSFTPIYYLSIVVGLASAVHSGLIGDRRITKGRYHWVYHICFLCIHLFFVVMSFYVRLQTQDESKFDPRIVLFGIYTSLFIAIVVLICHHLFRNGILRTINEVYELDKEMTAFGIRIEHQLVYRSTLGITLFLVLTSVWYSIITRESTKLYDFYYIGLFFVQYLIIMTMKSQFCIFNVALKYRFLALDVKLKEVIYSTKNIQEKTGNKIIMVRSADKESYVNLSPIADKIITLSEFHSKLYNISKRINLYFSVQILLITGKYFVEITATLYYNLQKFYKANTPPEERFDFYAVTHFIWAVMNAIDLLVLVYASDSMCSAANNCKLTLHKVNLNSKDIEMKKEVTAFSLQLLHNDLILTAAGFFSIDFTLIFNIIGAVTTYLVIFIQFDMSTTPNSTTVAPTGTTPMQALTTHSSYSPITGFLQLTTPNFTLAPIP